MSNLTTFAAGAFSLCLAGIALAGPEQYSGKEMKQVAPAPCNEWYSDNEWNVSLWGAYGFGGTDNQTNRRFDLVDGESVDMNRSILGQEGWGGGGEIKYFFHRYFGIGVEGFALSTHRGAFDFRPGLNAINLDDNDGSSVSGGALGTFTLRYPFHCSRFSPYLWAGGGYVWDSSDRHYVLIGVIEKFRHTSDDNASPIGQVGGGFEVRMTHHVGWTNDISWNFTDGDNFGMVRSGINFAF